MAARPERALFTDGVPAVAYGMFRDGDNQTGYTDRYARLSVPSDG